MKSSSHEKSRANKFGASPLVRKFASKIAGAAGAAPIIDVACGSGRNAMVLSELGCNVICADIDLTRLETLLSSGILRLKFPSRLHLHHLDLVNDSWPFGEGTIGS